MKVSYKKLWKLLIDRDMNRKDLSRIAGVSGSTLTKLSKAESVNSDMLVRICTALKCNLWDIMELLPENEDEIKEQAKPNLEGGKNDGKSKS